MTGNNNKDSDVLGNVRKGDIVYVYGERTKYVIEPGIVIGKGKINVKVKSCNPEAMFVFDRRTGRPQNSLERSMFPTRVFLSLQAAVDTLDGERLWLAVRAYFNIRNATNIPVNMLRDVAAILNLDEARNSIPVGARCK